MLRQKNIPLITCGPSQKDTFTYSSCTDDNIVVSLQRSIKTLSNKSIEPFEILVKHDNQYDIYSSLAYMAIRTEFDDFENNYL